MAPETGEYLTPVPNMARVATDPHHGRDVLADFRKGEKSASSNPVDDLGLDFMDLAIRLESPLDKLMGSAISQSAYGHPFFIANRL